MCCAREKFLWGKGANSKLFVCFCFFNTGFLCILGYPGARSVDLELKRSASTAGIKGVLPYLALIVIYKKLLGGDEAHF